MSVEEIDGMTWKPVEGEELPEGAKVVVGGQRFVDAEAWPFFNDVPLAFLGTVLEDDHILNVFIGSTDLESWNLENAGNCVVVDGIAPEWVVFKPVDVAEDLLFCEQEFITSDSLDEPAWLQGDETPDEFTFVTQIPSQVDGGELINIGGGYGTAYVFANRDFTAARTLWQS